MAGDIMAEFESWKQFSEFSSFVRRKSRHILDARNQRFLDTIVETSTRHKNSIQEGAVLWRAQLGGERLSDDEEGPFPAERMVPLPDRAREGRVNPKGIPCLYCSTDKNTAMTETRPWIGSSVSVAQFVMLRDLTLVDCSSDLTSGLPVFTDLHRKEPPPNVREMYIWTSINRALSKPVTRSDDASEYAPTQFLAEGFRNAGYDGIIYVSKLGKGKNVAIFDLTAAELVTCCLHRVVAVNMEFSRAVKSYFAEGYYESLKKIVEWLEGTDEAGWELQIRAAEECWSEMKRIWSVACERRDRSLRSPDYCDKLSLAITFGEIMLEAMRSRNRKEALRYGKALFGHEAERVKFEALLKQLGGLQLRQRT